jgi:hypothetical protein
MGLSHSPSIVTSNLILCLDAANPKSYSGSGNTWFDITGRGNNGTLVNGPAYSSNSGGFISCDGVDDYIEILDNSIFDFGTNNFSVEYWFRKNATTSGYAHIWGVNKWNVGGGGAGTNEWDLAIGNGISGTGESIYITIESGSTSYFMTNSSNPKLYLWNQLVGIRSGAGLSMYVNGALIGTSSPVGMTTSTSVNNISGRNIRISNSALNNYFSKSDSSIVRIYNKALSSDEVKQNYDANKARYIDSNPIITDGLIMNVDAANPLSYPGSGVIWADISGNNNNAILTNGPTFVGAGLSSYISFDGTNDYAQINNVVLSGSQDFTISAWVRYVNSNGTIFGNYAAGNLQVFYGPTYIGLWLNNNSAYANASNYLSGDNQLVVQRSGGSKLLVWLNGVLIDTGTSSDTIGTTSNFRIGANHVGGELQGGRFYNLQVYNRALTPSEIFHNFKSNRGRFVG